MASPNENSLHATKPNANSTYIYIFAIDVAFVGTNYYKR